MGLLVSESLLSWIKDLIVEKPLGRGVDLIGARPLQVCKFTMWPWIQLSKLWVEIKKTYQWKASEGTVSLLQKMSV